MGGRALLIVLLGFFATIGILRWNMGSSTVDMSVSAGKSFVRQVSRNLALGGVELGLRQLANNSSWRAGIPLMSFGNGKVQVWAVDTTFNGDSVVAIRAVGYGAYNTPQQVSTVSTAFVKQKKAFYVPAVITTRLRVDLQGSYDLDGRNRTLAGALIPNSGLFAVWTKGNFTTNPSASTVAGTENGVDYAPSGSENPAVCKKFQSGWPGPGLSSFPTTPDSVFGGPDSGYAEGWLKSIAQSGVNGSQYATSAAALSSPLSGVTYLEPPSGQGINDKAINGSGVLIVHNADYSAFITNTKAGDFSGIVIADHVYNLKNNLRGVVIQLASSEVYGPVLGSGSGSIKYCGAAVNDAVSKAPSGPIPVSKANVIAWKE